MDPERALLLVDAHSRGRRSLRDGLIAWLTRWLRGLSVDGFYDSDVAEAVATVGTAQRAIASQTWAYLDALGTGAEGNADLEADLRGVDQAVVWDRPLARYRFMREMGLLHDDAVEEAVQRASTMADDDLSLAMRTAASQHAQSAKGVTGLRRVIHPELSEGGTCGLCIAASDRIYGVQELLPIHRHCRCTVAEVTAENDPGSSLNGVSLEDLYEAAGSTDAANLKGTRYKVNEHGELGPTLVPKGVDFRGPREVSADRGDEMSAKEKAQKRLAVGEAKMRELEERKAAGEDVSVQLDYWQGHIKKLRDRAA